MSLPSQTQHSSLDPSDHIDSRPQADPILLEVAWEVARKVGGIHTVIRTKVPYSSSVWCDRYALIGIYNAASAATEFETVDPTPITSAVIDYLMKSHPGIRVYYGRWLIPGYPRVFLFDLHSMEHNLYQWRQELTGNFSRPDDTETNDAITFGNMVVFLLEAFVQINKKVVVQFHEWQAAVGLILARRKKLDVGTVFTTHATLLGRYLCAGRQDLYAMVTNLNTDKEAGERGIFHRHWIEKEAAQAAHVFTTVSQITAFEAEHILGRKADLILPNGLNVQRFAALHTFQNLHAESKEIINNFVRGHFYGYYDFDLDKTLYFFTAGRAEFYNKGVDVFIDGLAYLNDLLQKQKSEVTVIAFIIMPGKTNNYPKEAVLTVSLFRNNSKSDIHPDNVESLKGQSIMRDLQDTCSKVVNRMGKQLLEMAMRGQITDSLHFSDEDQVYLKRRIYAMKGRDSFPPIVTHNMLEDDEILAQLRKVKLLNKPEDRVKIIYHPEFLSSTSTLLPIDYSDFVRGCHLGVFPSYYEPWGYTPAECTVLGVPSVTSNLTGFSNYITRHVEEASHHGIFVCDRRFKSYGQTVEEMGHIMSDFCNLNRRERIELRNRTERLSNLLDWRKLGANYTEAQKLAFARAYGDEEPLLLNEKVID